jgi:hypothetical protein
MASFRDGRKAMGFVHTSCYVPEDSKDRFNLEVDRLKAERMLAICEESGPTEAKVALAQCNYVSMPFADEVRLIWHKVEDPAVRKLCKKLLEHMELHQTAKVAVKMLERSEDEAINMVCLAVAHSNMASVLYRELQLEMRAKSYLPSVGDIK